MIAPVAMAPPAPKPAIRHGVSCQNQRQADVPARGHPRGTSRRARVVALLNIDEKGNVTDVTITAADPPRVFDNAVIKALREWKCLGDGTSTRPASRWGSSSSTSSRPVTTKQKAALRGGLYHFAPAAPCEAAFIILHLRRLARRPLSFCTCGALRGGLYICTCAAHEAVWRVVSPTSAARRRPRSRSARPRRATPHHAGQRHRLRAQQPVGLARDVQRRRRAAPAKRRPTQRPTAR